MLRELHIESPVEPLPCVRLWVWAEQKGLWRPERAGNTLEKGIQTMHYCFLDCMTHAGLVFISNQTCEQNMICFLGFLILKPVGYRWHSADDLVVFSWGTNAEYAGSLTVLHVPMILDMLLDLRPIESKGKHPLACISKGWNPCSGALIEIQDHLRHLRSSKHISILYNIIVSS